MREDLEKGKPLPDYFKNHPIYYAGPAKTPAGYASGAFGPTTAGRMDSFVADFQAAGFRAGLALILGFMLFAAWNDLNRYDVFKFIGGLFT